MRTIALAAIAVMSVTISNTGSAQVNEAFADLGQSIEMARSVAAVDRKMLIMQEMQLTPEEAEAFWPLYDKYQAEIKKVNDARIKIITDYAAVYPDVSDEQAKALLSDFFDHRQKLTKTRKKYIKSFQRIVPDTKVLRFYQLNNKLDAILEFKLAGGIPLVEDAKGSMSN